MGVKLSAEVIIIKRCLTAHTLMLLLIILALRLPLTTTKVAQRRATHERPGCISALVHDFWNHKVSMTVA